MILPIHTRLWCTPKKMDYTAPLKPGYSTHCPVIRQGFLWQMQMSLLVRWTTSSWPASAPFFWKRSPWGYGPKLGTSQNGGLIHLNTKNTLNSVVCQVFDFDPYPIKCFAETVQLGLLKVEPGELPGNSFVGAGLIGLIYIQKLEPGYMGSSFWWQHDLLKVHIFSYAYVWVIDFQSLCWLNALRNFWVICVYNITLYFITLYFIMLYHIISHCNI